MSELHLSGLSIVEKRLVKAYATSILGGVRELENVNPEKLKQYVEIEIAEREINLLTEEE